MHRQPELLVCTEMLRLSFDYLEDVMAVSELLRFEQHPTLCDGCTNFLGNLRHMKAVRRYRGRGAAGGREGQLRQQLRVEA